MKSMRRVEQRVAESPARRASELAHGAGMSGGPRQGAEMPRPSRMTHMPARNAGRFDSPAATLSAGTRRSSETIRTPLSTQTHSRPLARTTHRTGSAPRRDHRRRRP